ncbi:hypothetical protein [Endozoicomonas ascidiicola]|uniref:hypothetical protein n=1 Tax=Endozoicomonas ascidiicola TaxID=1698521 RepID=UPI0012FCC876|nr:hypothetical protein [Endozoicomonas ascidiicola]
MTWNPTLFIFGEDESCNIGDEITWSCNSQQPKIDDTVYLIRVGQEPRGIVAKGIITQESFDESDFRDPAQHDFDLPPICRVAGTDRISI